MIRVLSVRMAVGVLAGWTWLLSACSNEPTTHMRPEAFHTQDRPVAQGRLEVSELPEPAGPVKTRRSDGVRVLRSDAEPWFAVLPAGRYAVPLTSTLSYEVDARRRLEVFGGTSFHPRLPGGHRGTLFVDGPLRTARVPTHPCHDHTYRPAGSTAAALGPALARQALLRVTGPRWTRVGGHRALGLRVTVPARLDLSACPGSRVGLYAGTDPRHPWTAPAGWVGRMWVVAIDGERFVVRAEHPEGASRSAVAVLDRMVDSIRFARAPSRGLG